MSNGFQYIGPRKLRAYLEERGLKYAQWGSPVFEHDCSKCIFLGNYLHQEELVDLYYCPSKYGGGSVVYRHGSEGHEYGSIPLNLAIMRDYHDVGPDDYHVSLRRIFDQDFRSFSETETRTFAVKISVVEYFETPCPECDWATDRECSICNGLGYTRTEKLLGGDE